MMKDSVSILNVFRNKYYTDGNNTENGIVANAIDDVLPEYVKLKIRDTPLMPIPKEIGIISRKILYKCPNELCSTTLIRGANFCHHCGQALDWSDER